MEKNSPQKIIVFQQAQSGKEKITGLLQLAGDHITIETVSLDTDLPEILDDTSNYLPKSISADLVLNFLTHLDLSHDLITLCAELQVPIISSGKKRSHPWGHTPPTCCGLPPNKELGYYGQHFGSPEFKVTLDENIISHIEILRGASCGATLEAARKVTGLKADVAKHRIGLETQFFCHADPANWDPINGKSPLHFAGKIHSKALGKAIDEASLKPK